MREQRAILRDEADPPGLWPDPVTAVVHDGAVDGDGSVASLLEAGDDAQQGGLA